jgi:hypothetical protein
MVECIIALFLNFYLAINLKKVFVSVMGEIVNMPVIDLGNYLDGFSNCDFDIGNKW